MNAIKESFDNLPAAVCIFDRKGLVRMMNRRMLAVGAMLLGSGIQALPELREVLRNPPKDVLADRESPGVYRFPDGSVLRFSEKEITDQDGQRYTEVIASDVSELMTVRARLHEENERLDRVNRQLRKLGEDMADMVREEEILNMKIRVHDDIGYSLLSVRRAYWQCQDLAQLHQMAEQWRTTIGLLHGDALEKQEDPISLARERAEELGVQVILTGSFPQNRQVRELFALAIRECTSNCIRHAGGTRIFAECAADPHSAVLTMTNDGCAPQGTIREGGGLAGLRCRVEQARGEMHIEASPRFMLRISIPTKEESQ